MVDIKIVEYSPEYAQGVADMWNKSGSGWGGDTSVTTAEQVKANKASAPDINMYLALDGDKVVGYCGLSEYREDEGSLYVPLLNVTPEYHGKKVGKALVLQVLKRTVELGWPRLDLYTWPGNTKAVPLYKKCGFFWERRDDTTHLMNFIPTVLQTEAVADFFQEIDWYEDSTRSIEVKPDGITENGIDYYRYTWEKNKKYLRMEFERWSRGLRLIETDDFLISASVPDQKLVFGRKYKVAFDVLNKSGKPLNVAIKGLDNKNIEFALNLAIDVKDTFKVESEFTVNEIREEYTEWQTHPAVCADIYINGKHALFKFGIIPEFPAKLELVLPDGQCHKNVLSKATLNIKNAFNERATFKFSLPATDWLNFKQSAFAITLDARERRAIPLSYTLQRYDFYSVKVPIQIELENGEVVQFVKELNSPFRGNTGMFGGETEKGWIICNGSHQVILRKNNNIRFMESHSVKEIDRSFVSYPQLGKPYSLEFSKEKPKEVEYYAKSDAMELKATYESKDFPDIEISYISRLYANGIVENYYEVFNNSKNTTREILIKDGFLFRLSRSVIPFNGEIVEIIDSIGSEVSEWENGDFTENWLFSSGYSQPHGVWWPEKYKLRNNHHLFYVEHEVGNIPGKTRIKTDPICFALGTFHNWQEFRNFVRGKVNRGFQPIENNFALQVNGHNPFVEDSFKVKVKEYKSFYLDGELTLSSTKGAFAPIVQTISAGQEKKETEFTVELKKDIERDIINLNASMALFNITQKAMIFKKTGSDLRREVIQEEGLKVLAVDNGKIKIKAAPDFSHGLFSMTYNGREWFDTSFPKAGPRSWFNPWPGGLYYSLRGLSDASVQKEKSHGEFVELADNFYNKWSGIKCKVQVEKNEEFKGLEIEQYFLMLPGLPIMAYTVGLTQREQWNLKQINIFSKCFLKPYAEKLSEGWLMLQDSSGQLIKFKAGVKRIDIPSERSILFGADTHEDKLLVCPGSNPFGLEGFTNLSDLGVFYFQITELWGKERIMLPAMFFIFTDDYIEDSLLKDLKRIKFEGRCQ